jgi:very-short-patch-repair endonuclease
VVSSEATKHQAKMYNKLILKPRRRELRQSTTPAEIKIWNIIRNRKINNLKFIRQYSVGFYILDFYCPKIRLAIEIDGGQHNDPDQKEYDEERTKYLNNLDIKVIRFWNSDVIKNIEGVYQVVVASVQNSP